MTNLKEGQRIDVYEVSGKEECWNCFKVGSIVTNVSEDLYLGIGPNGNDTITQVIYNEDLKPCGYYLKVKSIK